MPSAKHNPTTIKKIIRALKMGGTVEQAAGYAGVSRKTFYQWLKEDPDFADSVEVARDARTIGWLARINAAANGQWQAAAWLLERTDPEHYGRNLVEMSGRDGKPIETADASDYRARLISRLSRHARARSPDLQESDQ